MTNIYLIRHCEAEGNLYRLAQGHWNGRVTQRGEKQIEALRQRFDGIELEAVYSSDLVRAMETAKGLSSSRKLTLITDENLREICMGVWEGRPWGELYENYAEEMQKFNWDVHTWSVEGSESAAAVASRMKNTIKDIADRHEGKSVAIASHGLAIKIYLMDILGIKADSPEAMMHGDNTSVSHIVYDGDNIEVKYYNDNSHLGDLSTFSKQTWHKNLGRDLTNLYYVPLNLKDKEDADLYLYSYEDTWFESHGDLRGFDRKLYLRNASEKTKKYPKALVKVMNAEGFVGMIQLDTNRGTKEKEGWISLIYLSEAYRKRGLGIQLIGYAATYFSALGRNKLLLHVSVQNEKAIEFYKNSGFRIVDEVQGVASMQYLMEKGI